MRETEKWFRAILSSDDDDPSQELWAAIERDPEEFVADLVTWWNVLIAALRDDPRLAPGLYKACRRTMVQQDDLPSDPHQREWLTEALLGFFEQAHQRIMTAVLQMTTPTIEQVRALRNELVEFNRAWYADTAVEWLQGFHDERVQVQVLAEGTNKIDLENLPREDVPGWAAIAWAERDPGEPIGSTINRFEREIRRCRPDGRAIERAEAGERPARQRERHANLEELEASGVLDGCREMPADPIEAWIEREDVLTKLRQLPLSGRLERIRDTICADPEGYLTADGRLDCVRIAEMVGGTPG